MNITLYYVPGISDVDTPVFESRFFQREFFAEQVHNVITTGFYPPYLRNVVTLDTSDFNLTTSTYNYLSLEFNNKIYYYFIRNKRYKNEDVVDLEIEMDTIQTFMFDVVFNNAFLDRLSINRMNANYKINRDYIRENLSNGEFSVVSNYTIYNREITDPFKLPIQFEKYVIVKYVKNIEDSSDTDVHTRQYIDLASMNYDSLDSPYNYAILPLRFGTVTDYSVSPSVDRNWDFGSHSSQLAENADVVDIYAIPFRFSNDIYCDRVDTLLDIKYGHTYYNTNRVGLKMLENSWILYPKNKTINIYVNTDEISHGISYNTTLGALFDVSKVPAMYDENYTKITFGDGVVRTEYPLYSCDSFILGVSYWADLSSGNLYYNIYRGTEPMNNRYDTIVVNTSGYHFDLKNDPWKTYIASNRATLTGAFISSGVTLLASAGLGAIKPVAGEMAAMSSIGKGVKNISHYFVNKENLKHAPDEVKRTGNAIPDMYSESLLVSSKVSYCDDFADIARYYESYGYKVAKTSTENLFLTNYRYLYDYVQTKELSIIIGDKETEKDFIDRFNNGLRLWHTTDGELHCHDINGNSIEIGQVCVYDNLENIFIGG